MRLLLDSHAYLWWLLDDAQLSDRLRTSLEDPSTLVFVSAASIWELGIKARLGRLELGGADLVGEIAANGFIELPVSAQHASVAADLPANHPDPFDRMLIAQAQIEGLTCATRDPAFQDYAVPTIW